MPFGFLSEDDRAEGENGERNDYENDCQSGVEWSGVAIYFRNPFHHSYFIRMNECFSIVNTSILFIPPPLRVLLFTKITDFICYTIGKWIGFHVVFQYGRLLGEVTKMRNRLG